MNRPLLPAATKLGQGNVFTGICDSVNGGGGSASAHVGIPPPGTRPPRDQTPGTRPPNTRPPPTPDSPGADTPPGSRHPPRDQTRPSPTRPPPPPGSRLRDTVNERPVRILLECILVCFNWQDLEDSEAAAVVQTNAGRLEELTEATSGLAGLDSSNITASHVKLTGGGVIEGDTDVFYAYLILGIVAISAGLTYFMIFIATPPRNVMKTKTTTTPNRTIPDSKFPSSWASSSFSCPIACLRGITGTSSWPMLSKDSAGPSPWALP